LKVSELKDLGFSEFEFPDHGSSSRRVFKAGNGPGVILLHEFPGITRSVADLGRVLVAEEGLTVWMPYLFDVNGRPDRLNGWAPRLRACISREFVILATGKTSPITSWLRALARELWETSGGRGVGVIGMCMTGGFALAMMLEEKVIAPVLSQASLPLAIRPSARRDPGVDPCDLSNIGRRLDSENLSLVHLRFSADRLCPKPRIERLRNLLGANRLETIELPSGRGKPFRRLAHSVLTEERARHESEAEAMAELDRALLRVRKFIRDQIR